MYSLQTTLQYTVKEQAKRKIHLDMQKSSLENNISSIRFLHICHYNKGNSYVTFKICFNCRKINFLKSKYISISIYI